MHQSARRFDRAVLSPLPWLLVLLWPLAACDSQRTAALEQLQARDIEAVPSSYRAAAETDDLETVELLLQAGVPSESGLIPSARLGRCAALERLLDAGASPRGIRGARALAWSLQGGHRECADLLVAAGADIDAADPNGETLLMSASRSGNVGRVRLLIGNGADLQVTDRLGRSALLLAIAAGRGQTARLLVEEGAKLELLSDEGWSPLTLAAQLGDRRVVALLLDRGARIDSPSGKGWTALMLAARQGHAELARQLLRAGADPGRKGPGGETAASLAAEFGHRKIQRRLERLLERRRPGAETTG